MVLKKEYWQWGGCRLDRVDGTRQTGHGQGQDRGRGWGPWARHLSVDYLGWAEILKCLQVVSQEPVDKALR